MQYDQLLATLKARTPGPYYPRPSFFGDSLQIHGESQQSLGCINPEDAEWLFALMNLSEELLAVVEAAKKYCHLRNQIESFAFRGQQLMAAQEADKVLEEIVNALAAFDLRMESL